MGILKDIVKIFNDGNKAEINIGRSIVKSWPRSPLSQKIMVILLVLPTICAFLVPFAQDFYEAVSNKAAFLLDIIELGRGRPWVIFTAPYSAATLRMFGDVSGVDSILVVLLFFISPRLFGQGYIKKLKDPSYRWRKDLGGGVFSWCICVYGVIYYYIWMTPGKSGFSDLFFMNVFLASGFLYGAIGMFVCCISIIYYHFFSVD